jgi:hypothetical protein
MRRLKRGDVVEFIQNYKDVVKKGETHLVDKAMYVDGVLQCVYIKGETNYIYFDGGDFEWFCKPYENKNVECKVVYEYLNAKKQMEKEIKEYDYINPNHYKQGDKEVIEMMVDIWGAEDVAKYCSMNAFKYRMRMGFKPNQPVEQELKKATWYEDKAKELRNEQK